MQVKKITLFILLGAAYPLYAHAAEEDAVYNALVNITQWLTDDIGLAAGTLAIVGAGFCCMTGRIPFHFLRSILIGISLIYGAAFLAQKIIGA